MACGYGYWTERIREIKQGKVFGVDSLDDMITEAKKRNTDKDISYVVQDCSVPFDLGLRFDIVTAVGLLCNAPSDKVLMAFAENFYSQLKPGGRFLIIDMSPEFKTQEKADAFSMVSTHTFPRFPPQEYDRVVCTKKGEHAYDAFHISWEALDRTFGAVFGKENMTYHEWTYQGEPEYAGHWASIFESKYSLFMTGVRAMAPDI
jgi:SAM-dependent methyltransferase